MSQLQEQYQHYLRVVRRRRALILLPSAACLVIGAVIVRTVPPTYQASTFVMLDTSKTPPGIPGSSPVPFQAILPTLVQQLQSPSRIEMVITRAGIKPGPGEGTERLISRISKGIQASVTARESFQITFNGPEPHMVAKVTNALASVFAEENARDKVETAQRTVDFLRQELEDKAEKLRERDKAVSEFKRKNLGMLPDQYVGNATQLAANSQALATGEQNLRAAREQLDALESRARDAAGPSEDQGREGVEKQLKAEEEKLGRLRATLTERHPDVIATRKSIEHLRNQLATLPEEEKLDGPGTANLDPKLRADLEKARLEVQRLNRQVQNLTNSVNLLNGKLSMAPQVQAELEDVTRGNQALQDLYNEAQKKLEQARTWLSAEKADQGERFRILDPAPVPSHPYSPDPLLVLPISLIVGLGLGITLALLSETLNSSFHATDELAAATGVPVLGGIGRILTEADRSALKRTRFLWSGVSLLVVLAVGWAVLG